MERLQIETWRGMSAAEKARLISGLSNAAFQLAMAGVRDRFPNASPHEHFLRFAILNLGLELATKAYPEIADLDRGLDEGEA